MTNKTQNPIEVSNDFFMLRNSVLIDLDECIREMEARVAELRTYRHSVARAKTPGGVANHVNNCVGVMTAQAIRTGSLSELLYKVPALGMLEWQHQQYEKGLAAAEAATESAQEVVAA